MKNTTQQLIEDRIRDLRENTDFVSTLLESLTGYAIIAADFDGNIIAFNEGARDIYGYAPEEIIGKQSIEIFFPRDFVEAGKLQQIVDDLIGKGRFSYEGEKVRKNGERFPAQILFTLTNDRDGKVVGFIEIVEDLTERKRAEEARLRMELLREKVSELEAFSYGVAHDLRSPLLSIERFSYELQDDIQNQNMENVQEDIQLLQSGVRKMRLLVDRTLEYSRAGYLVKLTENTPFSKVVEEVIEEFAEQLSSVGATVSLADGFPTVFADRTRMVQLLTNLIQNSIKYRDKTVPLRIEIGYQLSEDEVIFFVRDNGSGIDEGETEKVFDLFYRGTADGEGSGAGLAIVKRIIEAHGGRVWAEQGQAGKGTTICFALPQQNCADN